ncbi:hypothetical protein DAI22_06g114800 [Oryza sativa Japonica Group]|nr:hypothetical protein DAI22_06g114800 [Oryza sativa Japonica Group]
MHSSARRPCLVHCQCSSRRPLQFPDTSGQPSWVSQLSTAPKSRWVRTLIPCSIHGH